MPTIKHHQGHKLRKRRFSESNRAYLLTMVTHHRRQLFKNLLHGRIVVQAMQFQHHQQNINSMAYVIMPDHLHWLVQLKGDSTLDGIMRRFKGYSALKINRSLDRPGRIWQAGYHDHAIRRDEEIQSIARYIIANPLRAGLVDRIEDYPLWDAMWI